MDAPASGRTANENGAVSVPPPGTPAVFDRCDITVVHPRTVAAVRESLIEHGESQRVADVFKVLGDPSRCRLVYALLAAGEICVCDLAAALGMSESNVSHHLRVLRAHGLVRPRRQGKMVYYAPDDEHISLLLDLTREHVTHAGDGDARRGPAALVGRESLDREAER
jgi:ArsR family transcriptional regulator, lead/cadmium/zinc/bismuth-responsive transcriptional repressor